jgi:hypothetical protein
MNLPPTDKSVTSFDGNKEEYDYNWESLATEIWVKKEVKRSQNLE